MIDPLGVITLIFSGNSLSIGIGDPPLFNVGRGVVDCSCLQFVFLVPVLLPILLLLPIVDNDVTVTLGDADDRNCVDGGCVVDKNKGVVRCVTGKLEIVGNVGVGELNVEENVLVIGEGEVNVGENVLVIGGGELNVGENVLDIGGTLVVNVSSPTVALGDKRFG